MNLRIFLLLMGILLIPAAHAVPVEGLYRAEIHLPVRASESQMLNEAFALAAEEVLIKVSGNKDAINGDLLRQAKAQASAWVSEHSVASLNELLPSGNGLVPGKQIRVSFYQQSIDGFLSKNNLPVWGENRPSVLVWLVSDMDGVRQLSGSNAPSDVLNGFARSALSVGVPIYAPLLDDTDKSVLTTFDVWGFFEDVIARASQRYRTDAVAALRVSRFAGQVDGSLLVMLQQGQTERFSLSGDTMEALLDQAAVHLAKVFSSRFASVRNDASANQVSIQIVGIKSFASLDRVQSYFESIGVVRSVTLVKVDGDKVEFSVSIDGDQQKLFNSVALNDLLIDAPLNALDPDANRVKSYQYSGVN